MEGECGEDQGDDGGGWRRKKTIRRRQPGEGPSTAAPEFPPVTLMEEEIAPAMGDEDEPVEPKKSELRSRLGWTVVWAIYDGLPDFQRHHLEGMGFGPFLPLEELAPDVALIQALKERWDPECHTFLFPWGHMIPTLEDMVQITGLRVDGQAVTGVTYTSYQEPVERLLGLERTALQESLGVANARHWTGEGQANYMAHLTEDARAVLEEEEGDAADRDLRRFLILVFGKLILGTREDPVGYWCLPLLEDLSSVGNYVWGAALLADLFNSLGTSSRDTGVCFYPYPSLLFLLIFINCGTNCVALASVGVPPPPLPGSRSGEATQCCASPTALVQWIPYVGENDTAQPWVERGRPYFGRDIWIHCLNTAVPLLHRLVARTLRLHQAMLNDWEQRGKEVVSEATSDEDHFRAYARRYGAQVYKGTRRPRAELDRAQQMVGGTSSSREDPGRSVLEGQLASAVARAEGALTHLQEREQELRNAQARMTTLEVEMAELRLRPEAAEEASQWRQEAAEAARWCQEAEEAARLRTKAGDLRTQLGDERHRCDIMRSEMKGLERALALVGRSRSAASRSGIPSGSAGHYLMGSSGQRRNE
ncbi:hypothetical protein Taro_005773 [Colocasia esculenta]|uniref:Aminotransferase-like plant mobile domain-containing protein n=1 Tax=Colocasia esculenta TaxID=4460 RepID=A0A843TQS2_COLES|nr:hypothetical protein [Colocasia esculenta]